MSKYTIEGGIDFFAELYKSLDNDDDITEQNTDFCLITKEPLLQNHVIMECGHKFNYIPLYHDLVNHKKKFNQLESMKTRTNINEIRCPYCRNNQRTLLPYYEDLYLPKEPGINFPQHFTSCNSKVLSCCAFQIENKVNSNPVFCGKPHALKICVIKDGSKTNFGDEHSYCAEHRMVMVKKYRADAKAAKKLQEKQEKMHQDENVVLGPIEISSNMELCQIILKSGPNKGKKCCKVAYLADDNAGKLCRRHYIASKS